MTLLMLHKMLPTSWKQILAFGIEVSITARLLVGCRYPQPNAAGLRREPIESIYLLEPLLALSTLPNS